MLILAGFAMTDLLTLKEGVTVVAPDHKPLLALVSLFGKRQRREAVRNGFSRGLGIHIRTLSGSLQVTRSLSSCCSSMPPQVTSPEMFPPYHELSIGFPRGHV